MHSIIGRKVGMTRVTDQHGQIVGATVVQATPNAVTVIRTAHRDGYTAIQIGHGDPALTNKPQREQLKQAHAKAGQTVVEIRTDALETMPELGSDLTVEIFKPGDVINVIATSKGRGTAGTVKRHHFKIGPRSHGSMNLRRPGSIGAQQPQRVIKGKRMAGHLGAGRVTVKHLEVIDVIPSESLLVIKGAVPGIRGALVLIKRSPQRSAPKLAKIDGDA